MTARTHTSPGKGEVGAERRVGVSRFDRTPAKTARARSLRRAMTPAEAKLWSHLRGNNMHGVAFRRQHPVGSYILDFYCAAVKLAVELDGGQHSEPEHARRDAERDSWFAMRGIKTMRFWNNEVLSNTEGVLDTIWFEIERRLPGSSTPTPALPLTGGGSTNELPK